jgi:hypothetical protein
MRRAEWTTNGYTAIRARAMIRTVGIHIRRAVGLVVWDEAEEP